MIHVKAAKTGVPLPDLLVSKLDPPFDSGMDHPGAHVFDWVCMSSAVSPVRLVPTPEQVFQPEADIYVHSPGYAWKRLSIDFAEGGERTVRMVPGGDLTVAVQRSGPLHDAWVRLRREGSRFPAVEFDVPPLGEINIDAVEVGTWHVTVELGPWYEDPFVLGRAKAKVLAGIRTVVRVDAVSVPEIDKAPLSGVVILPADWELGSFTLVCDLRGTPLEGSGHHFVRSDAMELRDGEPSEWSWDLGQVATGEYLLCVQELQYSVSVVLTPEGLQDLRVEVPPPGNVIVTVIDEDTGLPASDVEVLHWACTRPGWTQGGGYVTAHAEETPGHFEFRAPQCELEILLGWDAIRRRIAVTESTAVEFRLARR